MAAALASAKNSMRIITVAKTIVMNPDGQILLLRRSATDADRPGEQDYPGGWPESGETPEQGAVREALEEAGLSLDTSKLLLIFTGTTAYPDTNKSVNRFLFFTKLDSQQDVVLSHEHDAYQWVKPEEALKLFPHPFWGEGLKYALKHKLLDI